MPEYLTPGVYYERVDAAPPLLGARTDVAGFVGLAQRGPVGVPVRVDSWAQFQARFGTFVPWAYLAYAVKGFFEAGGRTCYVVRAAGSTRAPAARDLTDAAGTPVIHVEAVDPGTWAAQLAISVVNVDVPNKTFSFHVVFEREVVESFHSVSIGQTDPAHAYFGAAINDGVGGRTPSRWVRVTKLNPAGNALPDPIKSELIGGTGYLRGGNDGLSSLTVADFIGDAVDPPVGLAALQQVDAVAMLAVPDIHIRPELIPPPVPPPAPPPHDPCCPVNQPAPPAVVAPPAAGSADQPPLFADAQVLRVQRAMIEQCELLNDRVAVLEVPLTQDSGSTRTVQGALDWRAELASDRGFAALYHPWVKVLDPLVEGSRRMVPPCGHVAGIYARTDLTRGVHKAPANEELLWAEDLAVEIDERVQGVFNPRGVNCVRAFPGRGVRCYGGRTISTDPDWRYVNVRRLLCMIEVTLRRGMQWAVFEPNDWPLRQTLVAQVTTFLGALWRRGALTGRSAEEAFFVRCDDTNNPQSEIDDGRLIMDIGVAPTIPAEFVVFRIGRTAEELELIEG